MLHRLHDLWTLLATAWRIWREDGAVSDLEIEDYAASWEPAAEQNVLVLVRQTATPDRACDHNALHFADRRRRMH